MNYSDGHNFPKKTNFKTFPDFFHQKFYYKEDRIEFLHISLCMHEIFKCTILFRICIVSLFS